MGSVISQSLNIKTKIVYDLSSFGEQDSVSSASVSPLWPEVTNYSVISHLSCLSFHHRMSIYTTLNNSLLLCSAPSVPQPVVQSRRRPLLGPSPG